MDQNVMAERLKEARLKAGYKSAAAAAAAFGWKEAGYRHHEGSLRGFDVPTAIRYGKAFKVNPGWLLGLDKIDAPATQPAENPEDAEWLEVTGSVAAGVWREQSDWAAEDRYSIEVGPPPFRGAERFAVRMEGFSMDRTIPPGSDLECLRVANGRTTPQPGDLVIVERNAHDLTEMTCKRLDKEGDNFVLRCESTKAEFQEPIYIGRPNADDVTDQSVRVIGIVIRSYQRHISRRF